MWQREVFLCEWLKSLILYMGTAYYLTVRRKNTCQLKMSTVFVVVWGTFFMKALRDACVDYFPTLTLCLDSWSLEINYLSANRLGSLISTNLFVLPIHAIFLNSRSPWVFLEQKTRNNVSSRVLSFAVICIFLSPHVNSECQRQRKRVNKLLIKWFYVMQWSWVCVPSDVVKVSRLLGQHNLLAMGKK